MGKASKWLTNFLLGKKEEKGKSKNMDIAFNEESTMTTPSTTSVPSTPTCKRRWSFRKSSKKERSHSHKSSKSLDLITNTNITPLLTRAFSSLESENYNQIQKTKAIALAVPSRKSINTVVTGNNVSNRTRKTVQDMAATRIQASFRSYLARKALRALKGLVKLQALVRGHLVRKQTTATLRRMQALIAIQFKARQQRIQMAEESRLVVRSQSSRYRLPSQVNGFSENRKEDVAANTNRMHCISNKWNKCLNNLQIGRIEQGVDVTWSSDDLLSILKQEHRRKEIHFSTAQNSPVSTQKYDSVESIPGRASFACKQPDYLPHVTPPSTLQPNYMTNTESSKAKGRSQSEPKRRPKLSMRPANKQTASRDSTDVLQDAQMQHPYLSNKQEGWDPRFPKIHNSARSKEFHSNFKITNTATNSNQSKFLMTYEPHLNMY